jgi:hypothetical protein
MKQGGDIDVHRLRAGIIDDIGDGTVRKDERGIATKRAAGRDLHPVVRYHLEAESARDGSGLEGTAAA